MACAMCSATKGKKSSESRAAARAMLSKRGAQPAKPEIYRASCVGRPRDEDFEILDINSGLPVGHRCPLAPDRQPSRRIKLLRMGPNPKESFEILDP